MQCVILHESKNRLRVHTDREKLTFHQAAILENYLKSIQGITDVKIYERTGDAIICYKIPRTDVIQALATFSYGQYQQLAVSADGRKLSQQYQDEIVLTVLNRIFVNIFFPNPLRVALTIFKSIKYIFKGIRSLLKGKIEVALLDATAITVSMLRGDFKTASSVMFLLKIGDILEEWTHKKSVDDLAKAMSLNIDNVWLKKGEEEILVPISTIQVGDCIIVRTGSMIPLDGQITAGEVMVNQSSITGEGLPVVKKNGSYVYASTVVEEGECVVCVQNVSENSRYGKIVRMIEESEKLKSSTESQASKLADKLVPYSFLGTILTYLVTKNVDKALSILMVDFSCALKLAIPLSVLSAIREGNIHDISIKGGKFLETVSQADTIVFDKTGTLTYASPKIAMIETFNGENENDMLRLAACLEEHYPHSMAKAVVKEAEIRNLHHDEHHSKVEYVVAHGISSRVEDQKVLIGSYHFIFEDEGCTIPENEKIKFENLPEGYSHLYLAISGVLSAVICINDPIRKEAPEVVSTLRKLGIKNIVMMTGDNEKAAKSVAQKIGFDKYYAGVLPEDKANFIKSERALGRKVIMIGDGINDSPALSEADVGIAMAAGSDIAREISDITISGDNLYTLVTLKTLSDALMRRIRQDYRFIMSFNTALIVLGVAGVLTPATSALLHNSSTIAISLKSMTNLLPADEDTTIYLDK